MKVDESMKIESMKIEKQVLLRAPRARVWKALADPRQFGEWFRAKVAGEFRPGARVEVVSTYEGHEGERFFIDIETVQPERQFSWRWNPGGKLDDSPAPEDVSMLVVFDLEDAEGGTLLRVTETGFDRLSLARRAKAFEANDHGWDLQMANIARYVENR